MARKRPLRNPLSPPPPSPSLSASPSQPSIRKEESEIGNNIAEDEDNEEQMGTDNEEDGEEEEDDDDEEVQKVEKKPHVGEFKATAPTPSKSDSGSYSDNHFTIRPVVSKLAAPKPTEKMAEKAVANGSDVELILGLSCEGWEMGVKKPKRTSNSRLKTAVKTDSLETEVTSEEKVDEVEGSLEKYTALDEWMEMGNVPEGVKWVMRKRLREIEKSKVRGLEERWRSLRKAELELFVQRMDLVSEQLKLVLEAESSSAEF